MASAAFDAAKKRNRRRRVIRLHGMLNNTLAYFSDFLLSKLLRSVGSVYRPSLLRDTPHSTLPSIRY